jgi:hypothetical protein
MRTALIAGITLALASLLAAAPAETDVIPVESSRSPFCMVGESVHISVGKALAMVEGDCDFRYLRRYDGASDSPQIAFYYAVFAPNSAETLEDITAITGAKLHFDSIDFGPDDFFPMPHGASAAIQIAPTDSRAVILVFKIPRSLLRQQCRLHFSHYQPYYHYDGRTVLAFLPLLPDFETLKNELLFSRTDFTVEFETVDTVRMRRLSTNQSVEKESSQRLLVHPVDRENIAVEIVPSAPRQPPASPRG